MKTKYTSMLTILSAILVSPLSMAQQEQRKIDVKCFVELYGGEQSIYFAYLNKRQYQLLPATLVNRKVYTTDRNAKIKVYEVKECTLEENQFKSAIANDLESTMTK